MFVCKHDEIIGCVKADVWSTCQFDFISNLVLIQANVPKYSSDKQRKSNWKKWAEVPHMFQLSLIKM
jgi:hypothetical protein